MELAHAVTMARLRTGAWIRTATIQETHASTPTWRSSLPTRNANFALRFGCSFLALSRILMSSRCLRLWNAALDAFCSVFAGEGLRDVGVSEAVGGRRGTPPAFSCVRRGSVIAPAITESVDLFLVDL